jgi:hypothetical protein
MGSYVGVGMMLLAVGVFIALMPRGGEVRLKGDSAQAFALMALMLLFILGAIFALGIH